jgi:hypothetical protein
MSIRDGRHIIALSLATSWISQHFALSTEAFGFAIVTGSQCLDSKTARMGNGTLRNTKKVNKMELFMKKHQKI